MVSPYTKNENRIHHPRRAPRVPWIPVALQYKYGETFFASDYGDHEWSVRISILDGETFFASDYGDHEWSFRIPILDGETFFASDYGDHEWSVCIPILDGETFFASGYEASKTKQIQ